jgi:hypothetical protein
VCRQAPISNGCVAALISWYSATLDLLRRARLDELMSVRF